MVLGSSSSKNLTAEIERSKGPHTVGGKISEVVTMRNGGGTPKAWVEVEDRTDLPGIKFKHVASLGLTVSFDRVEMSQTATRRGEYKIGPLVVRTSDPFGMFPQEVVFGSEETILVNPKIIDIPDFATTSIQHLGETSRRQRTRVLSTDVASVREYESGDDLSKIHWLSTARTGQMMVKQFDQGFSGDMWVLFDQHSNSVVNNDIDSTDEIAATVAASVIDRYTRTFLPVGYISHGSQSLVALPDRSSHHRDQIIRHIATSKPTGDITILEALSDIEREFGQNTSLVVITAANDGPWVEALAGLSKRGIRVSTVLINRHSYGGDSNESALSHLAASGVSAYPLRMGQSIPEGLKTPFGRGKDTELPLTTLTNHQDRKRIPVNLNYPIPNIEHSHRIPKPVEPIASRNRETGK
ncbi:MAG: hypothetical protein Ct9H300mP19_13560 [Dehalococcoidia bacterium]|nr:MAG: hypothetical protein Ct9H300mP19_13560 [Dehalococcoidia bacterium]